MANFLTFDLFCAIIFTNYEPSTNSTKRFVIFAIRSQFVNLMPTITINTDFFYRLLAAPTPADVMIQLFASGGWVIFLWVLLWGLWKVWVESRQIKWLSQQQAVILAIDVPRETEQTPKAVESVFATLHGTLSFFDRFEKFWVGKLQPVFSFEVASIDGYVQFYVRTWTKYRDVVEAAIYAQYPDAEIAEVSDYTFGAPKVFPAPGWDLFGTEFVLNNKNQFPIRTHIQFEHGLSGDNYFKDPMGALLEGLSKIKSGEQVWIQILGQPNDGKVWLADGVKLIKKLIGAKEKIKKTILDEVMDFGGSLIDSVVSSGEIKPPIKVKEEPPSLMMHLSPGEKVVIEAVQQKLAKVAFNAKVRIIYVGKKESFAKPRTISMVKGVFSLFTILDQNGFRFYPKVTTKSDYSWQRNMIYEYLSLFMIRTLTTRQNSILRAYRNRSMGTGAQPFILNIEELASLYHFPVMTVKAPLLKKTQSKRGEPPFTLPISVQSEVTIPKSREVPHEAQRARRAPPPVTPAQPTEVEATPAAASVPDNLPFV